MRSPRALFAQRFGELYELAGNPTLRRVAAASEARMRAAQGGPRGAGVSAQRISDWKAGRNVPARFESLLPVVLTLVDSARKADRSVPKTLAEAREWQRLWRAATSWTGEEGEDADCPYPGLAAYRQQDRGRFFGRSRATSELVELVRDVSARAGGIVMLIGASGAGKSSLLAAGLVPALADRTAVIVAPGATPLRALADAFEKDWDAATSVDDMVSALRSDESATRPLLIIDQFEELFTVCPDEHERTRFLAVLHSCATDSGAPAVLAAVRADFYAQCLAYPALQHALEQRSHLLGPMRSDELAEAITGPAGNAGLTLESGLEDLVLTELCDGGDPDSPHSYDPGALPLLAHVMAATWQHREGRKLTIGGYRKAGGVLGSVAATAEQTWSELTETQRAAAREVLLGLVAVGSDSRDTRRVVSRPELLGRVADPVSATAVLEVLARARLVTLDAGAVTLTHEIMLTAWPRLRAWIDEDRVGFLVRQRLEADAAEWDSAGHDPSLLYRGTRLRTVLDHSSPPLVGGAAGAFLEASRRLGVRSRRRSTRTRAVLAVLGVLLLVAAITAYTQTRTSTQQREARDLAAILAEADRLQRADPALAAQLYLVAERMRPGDPEVRARLLATQNLPLATVLEAHSENIKVLAYPSGGRLLASASSDNTVRFWDVSEAGKPRAAGRIDIPDLLSMAFTADGRTLAVGLKNSIQLWDVSDPEHPRSLSDPVTNAVGRYFYQVAFTPDGRTLMAMGVVPGKRAALVLWDVSAPGRPVPGAVLAAPSGAGPLFAVSQDGRRVAIAATDWSRPDKVLGSTELWDTGNPTAPVRVGPVLYASSQIRSLAFSPDGRTLAVAGMGEPSHFGYGGIVELWDVGDPQGPRSAGTPIIDSDSPIYATSFAPDGRTIATGSRAGTRLWNVTDLAQPIAMGPTLVGSAVKCAAEQDLSCTREPTSLAFSPDGRNLATGGAEGSVRLWSLSAGVLGGAVGWGGYPVFDAAGSRTAVDSADGKVLVWDTRNPLEPRLVTQIMAAPGYREIALSPDGRLLAVQDVRSDTTRLYDLSAADPTTPMTEWRFTEAVSIQQNAFSPDWKLRVATTPDTDGVGMRIWDISDPLRPVPLGPRNHLARNALSVTVNPAGTVVAAIGWPDGPGASMSEVTLWDIADPAHPVRRGDPIRLPSTAVEAVTFHPDGRTLFVWGYELAQAWDISDPSRPTALADPVAVHSLPTASLDFTADGRTMVTSGYDGSVRLWDTSDPAHPRLTRSSIVPPGDSAWMVKFHPSGGYLIGGSKNGERRVWDLDEGRVMDRICQVTGKLLTRDLWERHIPGLPYRPPCE